MYGVLMIDIGDTTLTAEDIALIEQAQVGGVILFTRNVDTPEQIRQLCDEIRYYNDDILIGVDQEGGRVARLRDGFTPLPPMGDLGDYFNSDPCTGLSLAYDCGYLMAAEVLSVGIDMSFAPVLDINNISQVIGDRSFHTDMYGVIALATEFMQGMQAAGMATTGKHFPGHGSLAPDSHIAQAIDKRSYDQIYKFDMQPFIKTLPWLNALMPAHVIYPEIDSMPAGFSKVWLQDILRKQMKFDGAIFSDDLSMQAAKADGKALNTVSQRVAAAVAAGCDMVLVCNDRIAAHEAAKASQDLPYPNQRRLHAMRGNIPSWQRNFESTCAQFDHWKVARDNILSAFAPSTHLKSLKTDPTNYS